MLRLYEDIKILPIPDVTITTKDIGSIQFWDYIEGSHKSISFTRDVKRPNGLDQIFLGSCDFANVAAGEYMLPISIIDKRDREHRTQFKLKVIEETNEC